MKLEDFDFDLPKELIAYKSVTPRDNSRMLIVEDNNFIDKKFNNFVDYITDKDLVIFNDSKVIKAKLTASYNNRKFDLNLHKQIDLQTWKAFAKKTNKLNIGNHLIIADGFSFEILDKDQGEITIKFNVKDPTSLIDEHGEMPIPPYIKRDVEESDKLNYQTVFAKNDGSVAAPTAGLHFTKEIFEEFARRDIKYKFVTLHVGAGTFLPVKVNKVEEHKMHSEYCEISADTTNAIQNTKENGGRIFAVGTTSLRVLESAALSEGVIKKYKGETDIFIYPGYNFKIVDMLLTNFHLPCSTLFMLVCAMSGEERMKKAYQHAIDNQYRFFSYGDCCLLGKFYD